MTKTIRDLQTEAVFLSGLIGGADVLSDKATGLTEDDIERKMANNALPAVFEDLRRRADALADGLEELEKSND